MPGMGQDMDPRSMVRMLKGIRALRASLYPKHDATKIKQNSQSLKLTVEKKVTTPPYACEYLFSDE